MAQYIGPQMRSTVRAGRVAAVVLMAMCLAGRSNAASTILFVTQPPLGSDFTTVNSTFGNFQTRTDATPRGGDLYIRYGDGTLRNLTAEAGYGLAAHQEIAVREPSVHWLGTKALFSMVIGGTVQNDYSAVYWQIYEVSGLAQGQTAQITKLPQPSPFNNVSPLYGTDDRIIFTSDLPRNGNALTRPQLDEYESAPTVTGIWSMLADGTDLKLLDHSVSGDFTPIIAADGRLLFTRWDHLQRDQQNDEGTEIFGAFNYASEASAVALASTAEIFPEPRVEPAGSFIHPHEFNHFFPWQINEDGTTLETLNHVGRHELSRYFDSAHDGLPEFIPPASSRRAENLFQLKEDPIRPGYFYATYAVEFGSHAAGQIIAIDGAESVNADDMQVDFITDPLSLQLVNDAAMPPAGHPGHFRNPLPLTDGSLIAVHETSPYADKPVSGQLSSRYDFRLVTLQSGMPYWTPGLRLIPAGISKSVSYFDNYSYVQVSYSGQLWELDPVEVRTRPRPAQHSTPLPAIETQILSDDLGGQAGIDRLRAFLQTNNLALIVSRNVTRRADKQQDYNLKIFGSATQTVEAGGTAVEIAYLQLMQGDLIRGYSSFHGGRRPIAQVVHDALLPPVPGAPPGSVQLGADGSLAAFVPARRALTWQLVDTSGTPVVRERYWLTFAPGEMRTCGNCHGINKTDVVLHQPPPTNPPQALHTLAQWWLTTFGATPFPTATATATSLLATPAPTTPAAPSATRSATPSPTRSATLRASATLTPAASFTVTAAPPSSTPTRPATATPSGGVPMGVNGLVRYSGNGLPVGNVTVDLSGPLPQSRTTDATGHFSYTNINSGDWEMLPRKLGDSGSAFTALDAVYALQAAIGVRTLTPHQRLACDVNGDGTLTAIDAAQMLQRAVGLVGQFAIAERCNSDWAFVPEPVAVPNELIVQPSMSLATCQPGALLFQPLSSQADSQNFWATLFGDCNGSWQPPGGGGGAAARPRTHLAVRLGRLRQNHVGVLLLPVYIDASAPVDNLDVTLRYDSARLVVRNVHPADTRVLAAFNVNARGSLRIALAGAQSMATRHGRVMIVEFVRPRHAGRAGAAVRVERSTSEPD